MLARGLTIASVLCIGVAIYFFFSQQQGGDLTRLLVAGWTALVAVALISWANRIRVQRIKDKKNAR